VDTLVIGDIPGV